MFKKLFKQNVVKVYAALFDNVLFRQKAVFHLKNYFYSDLDIVLQLGFGLSCPIHHPSANCSFTEIFFEGEYDSVFSEIPLPDRWLDLGCHYGFFSLYVAWLRAKSGMIDPFSALLVDADSRVEAGINSLFNLNQFDRQANFLYGAIAEGSGSIGFHEQDFMSSLLSSLDSKDSISATRKVPIIDQETILQVIAPPYDLVKIDVEGGEYDFLAAYDKILQSTSYLIIEWHSWHRGGGSGEQILKLAQDCGFSLVRVVQEPKLCGSSNSEQVGVFLLKSSLS
jgi:FkbM family methyltransferase